MIGSGNFVIGQGNHVSSSSESGDWNLGDWKKHIDPKLQADV